MSLSHRAILVASLTLVAVSGAFVIELLLTQRPDRPFGHTQSGHLTGWLGLGVILLVFVYSFRKRYGPKPGWPKGWFRVHMIAGVLGPLLILIHAGAHFHALVPVLTLLALVIVVLSGVIGQAIHYLALRTMHDRQRELVHQGFSKEEVEEQLYRLASQEETFRVWQYVHAPVTLIFAVLLVWHIGGALYFGGW